MKKLQLLTIGLLSMMFTSCLQDSSDDWTLVKTIKLGKVSLKVPDSFDKTESNSYRIEVGNGFDGNSIAIVQEELGGRTEDAVFTDRRENPLYNANAEPTVTYGTLNGVNTLILKEEIPIVVNAVYHIVYSYIFIYDDKVFTIEFAWGSDTNAKSLALMEDVIKTVVFEP